MMVHTYANNKFLVSDKQNFVGMDKTPVPNKEKKG